MSATFPSPPTAIRASSWDGTTPRAVISPKSVAPGVIGTSGLVGNRIQRVGDNQTDRPICPRGGTDQAPRDYHGSLHIGEERPHCRWCDEVPVGGAEQVPAPKTPDGPEVVQDDYQLQFGYIQNGVHVQVVLRGFIVIRKEGGTEDGEGAQAGVGKDDVAAQVVPAHQIAEGDHTANPFRLAVAHPGEGGGINLLMNEAVVHRSCRSKRTASSGRAAARQGDPDAQRRGVGRKSRRLTVWL